MVVTKIRVTTRAEIYELRKRQHLEAGYRVEDEQPVPFNGFCSFIAVRDIPEPIDLQYAAASEAS